MVHRINFHAMGSDILAVMDVDSDQEPALLDQVPFWFEEWEQTLSRFRADSELTRLNQTFDQPVHVSETLWDVFEASRWAERFTNGLVTPAIFDAMLDAGYDKSFDHLPRYQNHEMVCAPMMTPSLSMVVADEAQRTLCLPQGIHLDFGGVAKGWAAHRAMTRLSAEGPALVNAGGDVAVSAPCANGAAWQVGTRNPFETGTSFEVLFLKRGGVATSGKDRRRWIQNGQLRHHIINPMTGLPAKTNLMTATVIASDVMEAEAASKSAMILGAQDGMKWIEENELAGLLVLENGEAWYSERMQDGAEALCL